MTLELLEIIFLFVLFCFLPGQGRNIEKGVYRVLDELSYEAL